MENLENRVDETIFLRYNTSSTNNDQKCVRRSACKRKGFQDMRAL